MQRKNVLYINYCAAVEDTRVRSKMHLDKTNPECYHHVYIFLTFFVNNAFEDFIQNCDVRFLNFSSLLKT